MDKIQAMIDNGSLAVTCPMEESADIRVLGILGNMAHFLCRGCGWHFARPMFKGKVA